MPAAIVLARRLARDWNDEPKVGPKRTTGFAVAGLSWLSDVTESLGFGESGIPFSGCIQGHATYISYRACLSAHRTAR